MHFSHCLSLRWARAVSSIFNMGFNSKIQCFSLGGQPASTKTASKEAPQRRRGQPPLRRLCSLRGAPADTGRQHNGPQFTSKELDLWAYGKGVKLDFSRPGKPTDNAFIEAFNSRFRLECLNQHWFLSLEDAREKIEVWRQDYNHVRPHSAIGNKVPMAFASVSGQVCLTG